MLTHGRHIQTGNMMFVSERAIRALNEIDGNGIMEDMMLRSKESLALKRYLLTDTTTNMKHELIINENLDEIYNLPITYEICSQFGKTCKSTQDCQMVSIVYFLKRVKI